MEVNPNRPASTETDLRADKTRGAERFSTSNGEARKNEETRSDANTRLSREADAVELSDEARELERREHEAEGREPERHE